MIQRLEEAMRAVGKDKKIVLLSGFQLVSNRIQIRTMTLPAFDLFPSNSSQISVNISSPASTGHQLDVHFSFTTSTANYSGYSWMNTLEKLKIHIRVNIYFYKEYCSSFLPTIITN